MHVVIVAQVYCSISWCTSTVTHSMPEDDAESSDVYKLMVLGDGGVGKSALTLQLVHEYFEESWDPTVEDSYRKTVVIDGRTCHLDILDTSGQDEFLAMRESNMRSRHAFLLVFAVDDARTFDALLMDWQRLQRVKDTTHPMIVVAANKCDKEKRAVDMTETKEKVTGEWNAAFIETSAKTRVGVDTAFHTLVRLMQKDRKDHPDSSDETTKTTKRCCAVQ